MDASCLKTQRDQRLIHGRARCDGAINECSAVTFGRDLSMHTSSMWRPDEMSHWQMGFDEEARKLLDDVKFQAGENKTSDALRVSMVR